MFSIALTKWDTQFSATPNEPILLPEQLPFPLQTKPIDESWRENLNTVWWSTSFKGNVQEAFEKRMGVKNELVPAYIDLLFSFRDHLFRFGGEEVCFAFFESNLNELIERGQLWLGDPYILLDGEGSQCHRNASEYWETKEEPDYPNQVAIATGYALSPDGMWHQHSWCVEQKDNQPIIVETTVPRVAYFGYVLTMDEAIAFHEQNV